MTNASRPGWQYFRGAGAKKSQSESLPFADLFRVYSPSLQVLTNGPVVSSIYDFADRLKSSNPRNRRLATQIDEVLVRNVGPKP